MFELFAHHHHHHDNPWADAPPWAIELTALGVVILERIQAMSKELDDLTAQVKSNSDLLDSATALINGIADRITAAGTDATKLAALTAELKANDDALATAILAGTPAKPATPA